MPLICEGIQKKSSFYQIVLLDDSNVGIASHALENNNLKCAFLINTSKGNNFFVIDAPQNLGRILKGVKNILLFNYSNDDFLLLIDGIQLLGYKIDNFDLLGSQFFNEDLSNSLEHYSCANDIYGYINLIKQNKIEITKFRATNKDKKIVFYRSGLIYSNLEISEINDVIAPILGKLNV
jgi:hypothetical protein